jgi:hypothetical protein
MVTPWNVVARTNLNDLWVQGVGKRAIWYLECLIISWVVKSTINCTLMEIKSYGLLILYCPQGPHGLFAKMRDHVRTFLPGATALCKKNNYMDLGDAHCNPPVVSDWRSMSKWERWIFCKAMNPPSPSYFPSKPLQTLMPVSACRDCPLVDI